MFPGIFGAKRSLVVVLLWFYLTFASRASTNHHVILITIDGLAAYYLTDAKAPLPTLRKLAAEGASAEGMRVSNPAITWPNHTTLVTGVPPAKHSVLFNGVLTRPGAGKAVRVEPALKIVNPNVAFRRAGLLTAATAAVPGLVDARAQIVSEGGIAMVYFTDPATLESDRSKVIELMRAQEGVAEILPPERFAALGLPDPSKYRQMSDLILVASDGYAFNNEANGDEVVTEVTLAAGNQGHHGYLSRLPKMNATFIAWGRGIKPGARLGLIENIDVAPTIAALLGQKLSGADGRVLSQMLADQGGVGSDP